MTLLWPIVHTCISNGKLIHREKHTESPNYQAAEWYIKNFNQLYNQVDRSRKEPRKETLLSNSGANAYSLCIY